MSESESDAQWQVHFSSSAKKQKKRLPQSVSEQLASLVWDLEHNGPVQKEWAHYGPLKKGPGIPPSAYHCHIKNGRPTYVVCWWVIDKTIRIMEIFYAGTHEGAPY